MRIGSHLAQHTNVFKIASGDITFEPVVRSVAAAKKPFIVSTGAANVEEIDQLVEWVVDEIGLELSRSKLILMHCICSYPAPIEQANVRSVAYLKERYGEKLFLQSYNPTGGLFGRSRLRV